MIYAISIVSAIFVFILAKWTLDPEKVEGSRLLCTRRSEDEESVAYKRLSRRSIHTFSLLLALGGAAVIWRSVEADYGTLNLAKIAIALLCLTGSACVDYIGHRIPNIFPLTLAISAVICLTLGFAFHLDGAMGYLTSSIFAAVASAVCLTLGSLLSHQGIGMGDIKLISALALLGGVYMVIGTLFFGMILCTIVSVALLLMKKKTIKDTLPFGPFILIGYIISCCLLVF